MDGGKQKKKTLNILISFICRKELQKTLNNSQAVYEWDTVSGKRIGDYVLKNCSYTSIALNVDGRNTYAVGSDRKLKEISDSQVNTFQFFI